MTIKIQFINEQTTISGDDIAKVMKPIETFYNTEFRKFWQVQQISIIPGNGVPGYSGTPDPEAWQIVFLPTSDVQGAAGYHELSANGLPLSKIFTETDAQYNIPWTEDLTHELFEQGVDPFCQYNAQDQTDGSFKIVECADAVEATQYDITYQGIAISDFVTPSWFLNGLQGSEPFAQYDYQKVVTQPFQIMPGGYIGVYKDGKWQVVQNNNQEGPITARYTNPHFGERRLKLRNTPRSQWRRSEAPKAEVIGSVSVTNVPGIGNEVSASVSFPLGGK